MRPRRILTVQETAEIIDQATRDNALAVITVHVGEEWCTFKGRFLERDPNRKYVVLEYHDPNGRALPPLAPGQYVGVSFRHKSRKVMFATVVEAKGRFMLDGQQSLPAIRYRWPDSLTELQRRAYYRTPVPAGTSLPVTIWAGGAAVREQAQGRAQDLISGQALDLSCGGTLVQVGRATLPGWRDDQTMGVEVHLPDGRPPVVLDAHFRGARTDAEENLCVAVQFVGLELTPEGRAILQRLARSVQRLHRQAFAEELRSGDARQRGR